MTRSYSTSLLLGLLCTFSVASAATISGAITDEAGLPIAGASVYETRTLAHDHTDDLGRFSISDLGVGDTLVVEAVGYTFQRLVLDEASLRRERLDVRLAPLALSLTQIDVRPFRDAAAEIRRLDLTTRPATNSQELLRTVPGLVIGQHAGGGKAEQMFLRGFDLDHGTDIAIHVDGAPVNMVSHAHGQGYADLHFVIPELVERVDFTKGPHDVRKGNFATAASVELSTAERLRENLLRVDAGQFNFLRGVGAVQLLDTERNGAYVAVEGIRTDGFFDASQDFTRFNAFAKTDHVLDDRSRLNVSASHFASEWLASGQVPDRAIASGRITRFGAIDATEGGQTSRSDLNVRYRRAIGNSGMLSARAWGARYDFELFSNFTFFLEDPVNGDQIVQREDRTMGGANVRYEDIGSVGGRRFEYEVGLTSRFDATDDSELSRTANRTETLERIRLGDIREQSGGAYANVATDLGPFEASAGVRYDAWTSALIAQPTPRLVLNATAWGLASEQEFVYVGDAGIVEPSGRSRRFGLDLGARYRPLSALAVGKPI